MERRNFLGGGSGATAVLWAFACGLPLSHSARAQQTSGWNKAAFETRSFAETARSLGAAGAPVESKDVLLQAPEISENGGMVRIGAQSNVFNTSQMAFVVEKNPNALAAVFDIPAGTDANVSINLKMAQSSNVYVLVKAGDKFFYAVRDVKVTLGGCGA